jgi:hypothetical protein
MVVALTVVVAALLGSSLGGRLLQSVVYWSRPSRNLRS